MAVLGNCYVRYNHIKEERHNKKLLVIMLSLLMALTMFTACGQREKTVDFVRKLKHLDYHVGSKKFDLMELKGKIQDFAVKYGLCNNERYRLEMCSEEMIYEL
ncbi:MAG: hypothetical protein KBS56_01640 [Clostridiales bacterium]|nr:hypothetical protein [Candidatus Crickella equi]